MAAFEDLQILRGRFRELHPAEKKRAEDARGAKMKTILKTRSNEYIAARIIPDEVARAKGCRNCADGQIIISISDTARYIVYCKYKICPYGYTPDVQTAGLKRWKRDGRSLICPYCQTKVTAGKREEGFLDIVPPAAAL